MSLLIKRCVVLLSLLATGLLGSGAASGHGGEDHGDEAHARPAPTVASAPRASARSDEFELVAVLDAEQRIVVTLDRFATNAPVGGARLEIDAEGQSAVAAEASPGVYVAKIAALTQAAPGMKLPLTIAIEAGDSADLLTTTLEIPAPAERDVATVRGGADSATWLMGAALLLAAVAVLAVRRIRQKRSMGGHLTMLALAFAVTGAFMHDVRAHGGEDHSHAAPTPAAALPPSGDAPQRLADGSLFVPKSVQRRLGIRTVQVRTGELAASVELNGTVIPDPESSGRIQAPFAGSVQPGPRGMPVGGRKVVKGEILAYLRPVASAIERGNQQALLAELEAQLAIAGRRMKRLEQLEGAVPQKEIEAARIERDALQRRRAFVAASVDSAEPLRAPATGVISASHHLLAGQIVDAREPLFEIVDPARLAVEALAYDPGIAGTLESASALAGETALALNFVGGGRQLREQALPLLFRIIEPEASIAVGQPVKVIVRTTRGIRGEAVPRQAMTKVGAGETAVWVHDEAERFVARKVRTRPLDAARVAVVDGLHDGDRVVTEGASLLSQVR